MPEEARRFFQERKLTALFYLVCFGISYASFCWLILPDYEVGRAAGLAALVTVVIAVLAIAEYLAWSERPLHSRRWLFAASANLCAMFMLFVAIK